MPRKSDPTLTDISQVQGKGTRVSTSRPQVRSNTAFVFRPPALANGLAVMSRSHLSSPVSAPSCKQARISVAVPLPSSLACCVTPLRTLPVHGRQRRPAEPWRACGRG